MGQDSLVAACVCLRASVRPLVNKAAVKWSAVMAVGLRVWAFSLVGKGSDLDQMYDRFLLVSENFDVILDEGKCVEGSWFGDSTQDGLQFSTKDWNSATGIIEFRVKVWIQGKGQG